MTFTEIVEAYNQLPSVPNDATMTMPYEGVLGIIMVTNTMGLSEAVDVTDKGEHGWQTKKANSHQGT